MGIREFDFLKKTLSKIDSNKEILHSRRLEKKEREEEISALEISISDNRSSILELKKKRGSEICNLSSRADYRRAESSDGAV